MLALPFPCAGYIKNNIETKENQMKNMRIGSRLGLGFALVLSLLVLMTIIGVWRLQDIGGRTATMIALDLQKERLATEWAANIDANGVRTVAVIKSNNADHQMNWSNQRRGASCSTPCWRNARSTTTCATRSSR